MMRLRHELPHFLYYIYDMLFMYLLLSFFYLYKHYFPPLLPYLVMVIGGGGILFLLYIRSKQDISFIRMFSILIVTAVAGILLGLPSIYAILLTVGIGWRSYINVREMERSDDTVIFLFSLIGSFLFYLFSNTSDLRDVIFMFPFLQLILLLVCKAAVQIRNTDGPKQARWASGFILFLLSGSSVLFLIIIYLKDVMLKALSYTISSIGYVIGLPIYWLSLFLKGRSTEKDLTMLQNSSSGEAQEAVSKEQVLDQTKELPSELLLYSIVAIVVLVVVIFLYKKRFVLSRFQVKQLAMTVTNDVLYSNDHADNREYSFPKDVTRKQLYQLEIKARKYGLGRNQEETVAEWFDRLPGDIESKRHILELYELVRYGEKRPVKEEALLYRKQVKNLLDEMKKWHKLEKRKDNK